MKKIIVTDPCYLISNEDWDKMTKECEEIKGANWFYLFDKYVEAFLVENFKDKLAVAKETGFGDWSNEIDGVEFGADSGMVCVVEHTKELQEYIDKHNISILPGLAAILPVGDKAYYEIDTSNSAWSVVRVYDGDTTLESLPADTF